LVLFKRTPIYFQPKLFNTSCLGNPVPT